MSRPDFPPIPDQSLSLDQVIQFLVSVKTEGHEVYQDPKYDHVFVIAFGELKSIRISFNATKGSCQVQLLNCKDVTHLRDVLSYVQLETSVASFACKITGRAWPCRPSRGRLSSETPSTNYLTISQLIGVAEVEAIFDPYLENKSLSELINILSFGDGGVADGVRLLGSSEKTKGVNPKFTKAGTDAWLKELRITGEARIMATSGQHRRFILLSTGQTLILGHSLNSIHKNEAIRLEKDSEDRTFFNAEWDKAIRLT